MDIVITVLAIVAAIVVFKALVHRLTVMEYERGLKYSRGSFVATLDPGQHWYMPLFTTIEKVDVRPRFASVSGQELLTADGVTLKVSVAANYEITDPGKAVNEVQSYEDALYLELQLALRGIIGGADIEKVLAGRDELSGRLTDAVAGKAEALGLRLVEASLKDIMFPGKLKEIFAQVVNARQEGLAALERARGETAALRNLGNAAKLLDDHPRLLQLRMLQAVGESTGNTLVVNAGDGGGIIPT